jgi:hypothetical protein
LSDYFSGGCPDNGIGNTTQQPLDFLPHQRAFTGPSPAASAVSITAVTATEDAAAHFSQLLCSGTHNGLCSTCLLWLESSHHLFPETFLPQLIQEQLPAECCGFSSICQLLFFWSLVKWVPVFGIYENSQDMLIISK